MPLHLTAHSSGVIFFPSFALLMNACSSSSSLTRLSKTTHDYGGFEKVGGIGRTLPSNDSQITTGPGDVILYNSDQIVLFYGSNSWSYTRIGKIQYGTLEELKSFLKAGNGNISVSLSL